MRTIYKYSLAVVDRQSIYMHVDAQILAVADQYGSLQLWALVDTSLPMRSRTILIVGTGNPADHIFPEHKHIGSVIMSGGALMWHIFDGGYYQ